MLPCLAQLLPDDSLLKILTKHQFLSVVHDYCTRLLLSVINSSPSVTQINQLECIVHIFHEVIILSPTYCKQVTWNQSLVHGLKQLQIHHQQQCLMTNKKLVSLSLYSRFELLAVLLRLSDHGVELFDDNFLVNALEFLMLTITDLEDMDESYHEIWCVAAQSLVETIIRNELECAKVKASPQVKEILTNVEVKVQDNSSSVKELIDDFKRVLCT